MSYPVRILVDGFIYQGEMIPKDGVFDAPTAAMESFLCDQEKTGQRVDPSEAIHLVPSGTGARHLIQKVVPRKRRGRPPKAQPREPEGDYNTQDMRPE